MRALRRWLPAALLLAACGPDPPAGGEEARDAAGPDPGAGTADSLYQAGAFTEARTQWEAALRMTLQVGDSAGAAEILTSLGLVSRRLGEYPEARRFGEEGLALKLRLGMGAALFRSYNALGLTAEDEGRLGDAASLFGLAAESAAAVGDSLDVAKAAFNMARVHAERGEPGPARAGFARLLDAATAAGDTLLVGRALVNLGMMSIREGDPVPAVSSLERARDMARLSSDVEAEENALGQLATAYLLLGEPQRAFAALDTALELAVRHGMKRQEGEDLKLLGDLYALAGDHRRALDHYHRGSLALAGLELPEEMGNLLRAQAESFRALGASDSAGVRATRADSLHATAGFRESRFHDVLLLAEIAAEAKRNAEAGDYLDRAQAIATSMGSGAHTARWAVASARIWERAGEPDSVLSVLARAEDDLPRLGSVDGWEPDALRARAHARLERTEAAVAAGRSAVAGIERVRLAYGAPELRTALTASRSDVYGELVVNLLRLGRVADAFEVADAARGRALLEHLGAARSELAQGPAGTLDVLRARELLRRIDELVARLESIRPGGQGSRAVEEGLEGDVRKALESARSEYEALAARVARVPDAAILGVSPARLPEVRGALAPGEALLEFMVSEARLDLFVVTRDGIRSVTVPVSSDDLSQRVRLAIDLVSRPPGGGYPDPVLASLHGTLVAPAEGEGLLAGISRLVIVPHGALVYLPFAALLDEAGSPMVERYAILHLASAAALPALRGRPLPAPGTVGPATVLAPFPRELPASRREAREVAGILGAPPQGVLVGAAATEAALRRSLAAPGVVHLATHGVMNEANPMFTRLELRAGSAEDRGGTGQPGDGRLEVREILALEVAANLVYLSGCETGRAGAWASHFARGEDYATLAQAFLYAGARNVTATLWRISDPAAAVFAGRFHEALLDRDPVEALASAQRALRRDPRYADPYYWAAYQLTGAGR